MTALVGSVAACGPFFEERHAKLAAQLAAALPVRRADLHGDPATAARAMGQRDGGVGLYSHLVPSDPKGPLDVRTLVVVREMLAQVSPMADAIFAVQGLGSYPVFAFGSTEQRESIRAGVLAGDRIGAFALTEPEAGTDVASLSTRATRDGDGWILDGEKTLISNIGIAHHYVVFANADPAAGRKGITAFLVPARAEGVTESALPLSSPHPLGGLVFRGCRVPDSARIGDVGQGFGIALATLDAFRISVGAAANGMAARALALASDRIRARKQFGKPLAEQQQVQAYIADMATELDAARLLVARAAYVKDTSSSRVTTEAAMAKMFATESAQRIIDRAVQLFGGGGVLLGSEVEALYRDIRPLRIYEGTTEIQRVVIARGLLG
ncbi:MAG: acyl-CoA dehydrogenase [Polyangiaceae bacterium]|nr:acyl-CoA dehydrogenase [Polyangiaceae bacterium]